MHQDALHELMENFRRQLLNIQVTIHDLQELIHSLNVFLLILQFRFHLWDVRFTLLLLCMGTEPLVLLSEMLHDIQEGHRCLFCFGTCSMISQSNRVARQAAPRL